VPKAYAYANVNPLTLQTITTSPMMSI